MNDFQRIALFLAQLNGWTWWIASKGTWLIAICVVVSISVPLLRARRRHQRRPAISILVRNGASALTLSAGVVAVCSLLHFSDLRWLPPDQRGVHIPGPFTGMLNGIVNVVPEWHAAKVAIPTAIACSILALVGYATTLVVNRRATKAEMRQMVSEEVARQLGQPV